MGRVDTFIRLNVAVRLAHRDKYVVTLSLPVLSDVEGSKGDNIDL